MTLLSFGCSDEGKPKHNFHKKNIPLVEVFVTKHENIRYSTSRTGTLIARKKLNIHNQEEGLITALPFYEGDQVKKGDILVKMDQSLLSTQLSKASATRKQAKQNFVRIQRLSNNRLISEDQLVKAKTEYEVAKAEEKLLQTRLNHTIITAPFTAIVTSRNKEAGDVVPKYTHLLSIIDPSSLVIKVRISELLLQKYTEGDSVDVIIDALGNNPFTGYIKRIHPTIDTDTRQGVIEVGLSPMPSGAKSGQLCRVTLHTTLNNSLMIPFNALQHDKYGEYVYVVENNIAKRIKVSSGLRQSNQVNIVTGLNPGMKIVTKGFVQIKPGKAVEITNLPEQINAQQPNQTKFNNKQTTISPATPDHSAAKH